MPPLEYVCGMGQPPKAVPSPTCGGGPALPTRTVCPAPQPTPHSAAPSTDSMPPLEYVGAAGGAPGPGWEAAAEELRPPSAQSADSMPPLEYVGRLDQSMVAAW